MKNLLQELTQAPGPSGYERAVRKVIWARVESLVDDLSIDALGNLIAVKSPSSASKGGLRIMIHTPMDEPGLVASHVDPKGFVRFAAIGPLPGQVHPGSRVVFMDGTAGIVACEQDADHATSTSHSPERMFIDVGASSPEDCPVHAGDVAAFERSFHDLQGGATGRALGCRAGVAVAIETLRRMRSTPHELYFVFTAQERMAGRGSLTASHGIEPELALSLGPVAAQDIPASRAQGAVLGKGPSITICDEDMLADPRVVTWMVRSAQKNRIPFQRQVSSLDTANVFTLQSSRSGVPTGGLSIPIRYLASPAEMLAMDDLLHCVDLLAALLRSPVKLEP